MRKLLSRSNEVLGYLGLRIHKELAGTPVVTTRREERLKMQEEQREVRALPSSRGGLSWIHCTDTHSVPSCGLEAIQISLSSSQLRVPCLKSADKKRASSREVVHPQPQAESVHLLPVPVLWENALRACQVSGGQSNAF